MSDERFKNDWKKIRFEYNIIENIRQNLNDEIAEKCLTELKRFYDGFINAASQCNKKSLEEVLDMFDDVLNELNPVTLR